MCKRERVRVRERERARKRLRVLRVSERVSEWERERVPSNLYVKENCSECASHPVCESGRSVNE